MSGGRMDYVYMKIADAAEQVKDKEIRELMYDLADLMHDLEWYKSGDTGEDDYNKTLTQFKDKWFGRSTNERINRYIDSTVREFAEGLKLLIGEQE